MKEGKGEKGRNERNELTINPLIHNTKKHTYTKAP
jgi:hypothetical protein